MFASAGTSYAELLDVLVGDALDIAQRGQMAP
jgi:hypothetical protein